MSARTQTHRSLHGEMLAMTTTPETIAELKRLLAEATQGPWYVKNYGRDELGLRQSVALGFAICNMVDNGEETAYTASLIAMLVNLAPSLLTDLEAAQKRERVLREAGQRLLPYIPQILSPEPTCEFEHYHAAKAFRAALAATEGK